jgi:predicted dehydrogenase
MKPGIVRWGLLGTARINERLIPAIAEHSRSELVAVASRTESKAEAYANQRGIRRSYGSYEALLQDSEIDAIYLSLPNGFHEEWSIKCAEAGKHVLCEKPLALTVEEVDRIIAAAKQYNVIVQEASMYRFHPQTHKVQALVADGVIGEVRLLRAVFSFTLVNPGDVRLDPAIGGGSLWDIGVYPVSFFRTIMRANPVEVFGWQVTGEQEVDMTFMGQLRFASGALAQFGCSFQASPHTEVEIVGTDGRLKLNLPWRNRPGETGHIYVTRKGAASSTATFGDNVGDYVTETVTYPGTASDAYLSEVESMVSSIMDGTRPEVSLEDSRGNTATIVALHTSARENRPVALANEA